MLFVDISGVYVENQTEYVVRSPAEALSLIAFGRRRLVFAETKMNRTSSRYLEVHFLSFNHNHSICFFSEDNNLTV